MAYSTDHCHHNGVYNHYSKLILFYLYYNNEHDTVTAVYTLMYFQICSISFCKK